MQWCIWVRTSATRGHICMNNAAGKIHSCNVVFWNLHMNDIVCMVNKCYAASGFTSTYTKINQWFYQNFRHLWDAKVLRNFHIKNHTLTSSVIRLKSYYNLLLHQIKYPLLLSTDCIYSAPHFVSMRLFDLHFNLFSLDLTSMLLSY